MNRAARRAYEREVKKKPNASICPKCKHLAMFFTQARPKNGIEMNDKLTAEDFNTVLVCERCGEVIHDEPEVGKLLQPGVYLPLKLDLFEYALRHPDTVNTEPDAEAVIDREFGFNDEENKVIDAEFEEINEETDS